MARKLLNTAVAITGFLCGGFLLVLVILIIVHRANAHDAKAWSQMAAGDSRRADWFSSLKTNNGGSCCNVSDCHQTDARQRPDQTWEAVVTTLSGEKKWTPVPSEKILKRPLSLDGEAYICHDQTGMFIYCFVPPIPGY